MASCKFGTLYGTGKFDFVVSAFIAVQIVVLMLAMQIIDSHISSPQCLFQLPTW